MLPRSVAADRGKSRPPRRARAPCSFHAHSRRHIARTRKRQCFGENEENKNTIPPVIPSRPPRPPASSFSCRQVFVTCAGTAQHTCVLHDILRAYAQYNFLMAVQYMHCVALCSKVNPFRGQRNESDDAPPLFIFFVLCLLHSLTRRFVLRMGTCTKSAQRCTQLYCIYASDRYS